MMVLNIRQQYAKISLEIKPPQIQLETEAAKLEFQTEAAQVEIESPEGILEIDMTPTRACYGIKTREEMIREYAEMGKRAVEEFTVKTVEDGNRLGNYAKSGATISQLAAESSIKPQPSITWSWLEPPDIKYTAQPVEYNVTPDRITFNPQRGSLDNQLDWGEVNVGMAQYQSIRFWTTEGQYSTDIQA